jgi:pyridoxamine 5'-phosphate oxidase
MMPSPPEVSPSRRWESRLSAWTSAQSQPTRGRRELLERMATVIETLGLTGDELLRLRDQAPIPRPPHWGGFRLYASRVELWLGGTGRLHDRGLWVRELRVEAGNVRAGPWSASRLQP